MKLFIIIDRLYRETDGQDMVEYALLGGMIALVSAAAFPQIAEAIEHVMKLHVGRLLRRAARA